MSDPVWNAPSGSACGYHRPSTRRFTLDAYKIRLSETSQSGADPSHQRRSASATFGPDRCRSEDAAFSPGRR
jgi:hypothetical protein